MVVVRAIVFFLLLAGFSSPVFAADAPAPLNVELAKALAGQMRASFTPEKAHVIVEKGPIVFDSWQGFYAFTAVLHNIEPTPDNLLALSAWSTIGWGVNELMGWWYGIMKVDFDTDSTGLGSIRGPKKEGTYFVVAAENKKVVLFGAFGGNAYKFSKEQSGMPVIVPFWPKQKDCCFTTALAWNGKVYHPSSPVK